MIYTNDLKMIIMDIIFLTDGPPELRLDGATYAEATFGEASLAGTKNSILYIIFWLLVKDQFDVFLSYLMYRNHILPSLIFLKLPPPPPPDGTTKFINLRNMFDLILKMISLKCKQ